MSSFETSADQVVRLPANGVYTHNLWWIAMACRAVSVVGVNRFCWCCRLIWRSWRGVVNVTSASMVIEPTFVQLFVCYSLSLWRCHFDVGQHANASCLMQMVCCLGMVALLGKQMKCCCSGVLSYIKVMRVRWRALPCNKTEKQFYNAEKQMYNLTAL